MHPSRNIMCPAVEIDTLIGFKYTGYHPVKEQSSDHLHILGNSIGCCIGGSSHPLFYENTKMVIQHVSVLHDNKVCIKDFYETRTIALACAPK